MDLKEQQINWAMYAKWTNQKQQRQKDSMVKLMNNEEDDTKVVDEGGNLVPNGSCMNVIMLEKIMHYLKFA